MNSNQWHYSRLKFLYQPTEVKYRIIIITLLIDVHEYVPVLFDEQNFCATSCTFHATVMGDIIDLLIKINLMKQILDLDLIVRI